MIYVSPLFEKKLRFITEKFQLREIVSATLSTQIFVLPLILYMMGQFSVVALPVNLLILPIIPVTMFFGFITSLAGAFGFVAAAPFGLISYLFLHYILRVAEFSANLPIATFGVPPFPALILFAVYAAYVAVLIWLYGRKASSIKVVSGGR